MASAPALRTSFISGTTRVYSGITSNPYNALAPARNNIHLINTMGAASGIDVNLPALDSVRDGTIITIADENGMANTKPISIYPPVAGDIPEFTFSEPIIIDVPYSAITFQACNGAYIVLNIK